ncbi:MAG TPA: hypothetical protein PLH19_05705 [Anaerolineae bacterium]|nr:hypothetical protein [Anaerolineae bacterium]HQH38017.1 hypothetical protein [Anaerolineae bacterium]
MARYLLAAEADKIQDLLFRSARLREVVGGSQLLSRFCKETPQLLNVPKEDIIISDGGSFRILFDRQEQAQAFGADLAEVYRRATGGSLSIAEPVAVNDDFGKASAQAEENLRQAKRWRENWKSQEHLPYVAFCASCGVGLAKKHTAYHENQDPQYLCPSCLTKGAERATGAELGDFLREFYGVVVGLNNLRTLDWPGKQKRRGCKEIDPLEDVADYDPRRYVAYLVADGNNMGQIFGKCQTPEQMRDLSKGLSEVVRKALAEPAHLAMDAQHQVSDRENFVPVLPLILGGDDLFALIPAPWALDFSLRFCQVYEREMKALLERIGLQEIPIPTVAAAVVICKSKHPYALAHEAGESRLKEAKRMGKQRVLDGEQPCSTLNFEIVLGGRLVEPVSDKLLRATLRPYWGTKSADLNGWGLSVKQLLEHRYELRSVPHKRLVELRSLYDDLPESLKPDSLDPWKARLEQLQVRIGRKEKHREAVDTALSTLGGKEPGYWRKVDRPPQNVWHGHGLPDLLEVWDFALDLDKNRQDYEEEAE